MGQYSAISFNCEVMFYGIYHVM